MLEEELIQLRQVKEELQTYTVLQKKLIEQQQEQIALLEKHNYLQAQVDLQKKLVEQQQEHVSLLEKQNHLQEQQINALREEVNVLQEQQLGQISPDPKDSIVQTKSPRQKNSKKRSGQQDYAGQRPRFSSPLVVMGLVVLVLLLLGGSLGVYSITLGHLPWLHNPTPGGHISATTPTPTPTPLSSNSSSPSNLKLNAANIHAQMGNLLIQSNNGFQCPYSSASGGFVPNQLVLASDRTTYSQNEIAQMRTYITGNSSFEIKAKPDVEPPPTLSWVLGAPTSTLPATTGMDCEAALNLTNTGTTSIQIPKVGVQLEAHPQPNTYQYHLIDVCSFIPRNPNALPTRCNPPVGGGGACNFYSATIQLGFGEKNDIYSAVPAGINYSTIPNTDCGTLTLAPAAQVELTITFSLATNTPANLIYSILPVLTVVTAQNVQTLSLPQLISTFAFASAHQFSCYGLQGTTLVLEKSPNIQQNWCL